MQAMDPALPIIQRNYPLSMAPMRHANDPDDIIRIIPQPCRSDVSQADTFEELSVNDLETLIEYTNDDDIIRFNACLKQLARIQHNYHFLIGDHGTGKTALAKAIAYKVLKETEWSCAYISAHHFIAPWRNQTAVQFRKYLKKVGKLDTPTVLILDNLSLILSDPKNSDLDTAMNTLVLTDFLDEHKESDKLFVFGILSRGYCVDERLINRIDCFCTLLNQPIRQDIQRIILTSKIVDEQTHFAPQVTTQWLEDLLRQNPMQDTNMRNFTSHLKEYMTTPGVITRGNIEMAISNYQEDHSPYRPCPYRAALGVNYARLQHDEHVMNMHTTPNQKTECTIL